MYASFVKDQQMFKSESDILHHEHLRAKKKHEKKVKKERIEHQKRESLRKRKGKEDPEKLTNNQERKTTIELPKIQEERKRSWRIGHSLSPDGNIETSHGVQEVLHLRDQLNKMPVSYTKMDLEIMKALGKPNEFNIDPNRLEECRKLQRERIRSNLKKNQARLRYMEQRANRF